jgi:hypothetical protein
MSVISLHFKHKDLNQTKINKKEARLLMYKESFQNFIKSAKRRIVEEKEFRKYSKSTRINFRKLRSNIQKR